MSTRSVIARKTQNGFTGVYHHPTGGKMIGMFGCGDPEAKWYRVAVVDLLGAEPDWTAIENFEPIQPVLN